MNYFQQLRAFRIRKKLCQLAAPEIALWFALMSIGNELGQYDRLSLSESTLMEEAGLSRSSYYRARNKLKQHGLINFTSRKGSQSALFSLPDLSIVFHSGTQNETQCGTQSETQCGTQSGTIYQQNLTEPNREKKISYNNSWMTSARARAAVAQNLLDGWEAVRGHAEALRGMDANRILCDYMAAGMSPEQIQDTLTGCALPWCLENHLFTEAVHLGVLTEESALCPNGYYLERG